MRSFQPESRSSVFFVFLLTWTAYAAFYLCRTNLRVVILLLNHGQISSKDALANTLFAFSIAYTIGQFAIGPLADRYGPRRTVSAGMLLSAGATFSMGFCHTGTGILIMQVINGFAQASGWSGLLKLMALPSLREQRGRVMAWWSTSYAAGGLLGGLIATYAATNSFFGEPDWKRAAWVPAILLGVIAILFYCLAPDSERETQNRETHNLDGMPRSRRPFSSVTRIFSGAWGMVFSSPRMRGICSAYFCVKFLRYSFIFWLPILLADHLSFGVKKAAYISSVLEIFGIAGVLAAGYASDKLFGARRFPVSAWMLVLLCLACFVELSLATPHGDLAIAGVGLIGFLVFGPDTLLVGTATQDASRPGNVATAGGVVDGFGSFGQLLSPLLVSRMTTHFGWDGFFLSASVVAIIGATLLFIGSFHERPMVNLLGG